VGQQGSKEVEHNIEQEIVAEYNETVDEVDVLVLEVVGRPTQKAMTTTVKVRKMTRQTKTGPRIWVKLSTNQKAGCMRVSNT